MDDLNSGVYFLVGIIKNPILDYLGFYPRNKVVRIFSIRATLLIEDSLDIKINFLNYVLDMYFVVRKLMKNKLKYASSGKVYQSSDGHITFQLASIHQQG